MIVTAWLPSLILGLSYSLFFLIKKVTKKSRQISRPAGLRRICRASAQVTELLNRSFTRSSYFHPLECSWSHSTTVVNVAAKLRKYCRRCIFRLKFFCLNAQAQGKKWGAGNFPQFNFVNHFFLAKNLLIVLNDSFVFIGVTHTAQCLRIKEVSWSCYLFVSKVINRIMFLTADFGRGDDQPQAVSASKSAVLSLLLSLHKQRK